MRIISGKLKGSKIRFIKNTSTRPLKDSVKENIFNIINHSKKIVEIKRANILDIYSGIGSFGLECISREAEKVTFRARYRSSKNTKSKYIIYLLLKCKNI